MVPYLDLFQHHPTVTTLTGHQNSQGTLKKSEAGSKVGPGSCILKRKYLIAGPVFLTLSSIGYLVGGGRDWSQVRQFLSLGI